MGEAKARRVFSLTSTGPGIWSLTCAIDCEIFHKVSVMTSQNKNGFRGTSAKRQACEQAKQFARSMRRQVQSDLLVNLVGEVQIRGAVLGAGLDGDLRHRLGGVNLLDPDPNAGLVHTAFEGVVDSVVRDE